MKTAPAFHFHIRHLLRAVCLMTVLALGAGSAPAQTPEPVKADGFAIAVIPDSQHYTWKNPEIYKLQTRWIATNVINHRIAFVLHVGDVTQHNTEKQWKNAREAHKAFYRMVPAAYVPGNHDLGTRGKTNSRESFFSKYITLADYRAQPGFGGVYDREPKKTENSWHTFTAGGRNWLVLAIEFAPRDDVLRWAGEIVSSHPKHSVIMITHAYMRSDGTRYDRNEKPIGAGEDYALDRYALAKVSDNGGFNDAGDMWRKLVSQHPNFVLVVSGHTCTSAHLASKGVHGNIVHQVLVDYQSTPNEKNGWLRLLQFQPNGRTVRVRDYSPLLNQTSGKPSCAFDFKITPVQKDRSEGKQ